MASRPAKAAASINRVERGRWKFVSRTSTTSKPNPGVMKRSVGERQIVVARKSLRAPRRGLERTDDRRPHRDDPASAAMRLKDLSPSPGRQRHLFRLERMPGRVVDSHRFERAGPHGERQIGDGDRTLGETVEHLRREMETRGGCGDRERFSGENRLIGLSILRPVRGAGRAADVRRQRHVPDALQKFVVDRAIKDDLPPPVRSDFRDDGVDSVVESHALPGLGAAAGLGQGEPTPLVGVEALEQENLDETSLAVAAPEAGRPHGSVVAHKEISRRESVRQIREHPMRDGAGLSVKDEHPARASRMRLLRDQLGGQIVVEEIDAHVDWTVILSEAKDLLPVLADRSRFFVASLLRMTQSPRGLEVISRCNGHRLP